MQFPGKALSDDLPESLGWGFLILAANRTRSSVTRSDSKQTRPLRFDFTVPAHPMSLGFVRRAMYTLSEYCGPDVAETLALVFSELMTNAIRHSGVPENDPLDVELEIGPSIRGAVSDRGAGFDPRAAPQAPSAEGGFGLRIVDRLARTWGVERSDGGSSVWFEL